MIENALKRVLSDVDALVRVSLGLDSKRLKEGL